MKRLWVVPVIVATLAGFGCNRSSEPVPVSSAAPNASSASAPQASAPNSTVFVPGSDADLVRQAVENHVRSDRGINLSALDMSVDSVNVTGNQADAEATFRTKQGGATMVMIYYLERHGNGWLVTKDEPANGQFVHPPMDQVHSDGSSGAPSPSGSGMPDVHEFLKTHPTTNKN